MPLSRRVAVRKGWHRVSRLVGSPSEGDEGMRCLGFCTELNTLPERAGESRAASREIPRSREKVGMVCPTQYASSPGRCRKMPFVVVEMSRRRSRSRGSPVPGTGPLNRRTRPLLAPAPAPAGPTGISASRTSARDEVFAAPLREHLRQRPPANAALDRGRPPARC